MMSIVHMSEYIVYLYFTDKLVLELKFITAAYNR